ncbi:MAG TPA: response regulator [Polyangiaceae bacterium]|nr:response regulator [Polyangiaceae bacterium]
MTDARRALLGRFRAAVLARLRNLQEFLDELEVDSPRAGALELFLGELHTLKGETRMLGLETIADVAHRLEDAFSNHAQPAPGVARRALNAMQSELDESGGDEQALRRVASDLGMSLPEPALAPSVPAASTAPDASSARKQVRWTQVDAAAIDALCEKVADLAAAFAGMYARTALALENSSSKSEFVDRFEKCRGLLDDATARAWALRLTPVEPTLRELAEHARKLAEQLGKSVQFEIHATGVELERDVLDQLGEPLLHLIQNAIDHGLELPEERDPKPATGTIRLTANSLGPSVTFAVEDDGRGIDPDAVREKAVARGLLSVERAGRASDAEVLELLFEHGFSTRDRVDKLSGRGVGLDVVRRKLASLGGRVEISSELGRGTRFAVSVPFAITKEPLLIVVFESALYALPSRIVRAVLSASDAGEAHGQNVLHHDGEAMPLLTLSEVLGTKTDDEQEFRLVLELGGQRYGLAVPAVLGEWELIRRPAEPVLASTGVIGASAMLEDGRLVLVLELEFLRRRLRRREGVTSTVARPRAATKRILVVDDSPVVRELLSEILASAGLVVHTAENGLAALAAIEQNMPDLVLSDVEMPRMGGFDLLAEIRHRSQRLPVVMLTTLGSVEDRRRAASLGANAYLVKTEFQGDALLEVVLRLAGAA